MVLGIDPGPKESAWVWWDGKIAVGADNIPNEVALNRLRSLSVDSSIVSIELPRSNFRPVSNDFLDMCLWVGRFDEAIRNPQRLKLIPYRQIAQHITGNASAQEKFVRQTLKERYGETGTKKAPGPMYLLRGLGEHVWSALAVAVTAADQIEAKG